MSPQRESSAMVVRGDTVAMPTQPAENDNVEIAAVRAAPTTATRRVARATAADEERVRRFHDAALPHLDDAYSLARYLMGNQADAEDAVHECYLLAHRHFDSVRGATVKPWLLSILRNVCYTEFRRRRRRETPADFAEHEPLAEAIWHQRPATPEDIVLRRIDAETVRRLLDALPAAFREILVLREINELTYDEIAAVIGKPVGTVMSRLCRARAKLRDAWMTADAATVDQPA